MSDNDPGIGKLIEGEGLEGIEKIQRDAVHFALAPVVASEKLHAGQDIGFCASGKVACVVDSLGIVDPFLKTPVYLDDRFWMFLYPNTITSLHHVWKHPEFDSLPENYEPSRKEESKEWLMTYANQLKMTLDELLGAAEAWVNRREMKIEGGKYEGVSLVVVFWKYYQHYTGRTIPKSSQSNFFSCRC